MPGVSPNRPLTTTSNGGFQTKIQINIRHSHDFAAPVQRKTQPMHPVYSFDTNRFEEEQNNAWKSTAIEADIPYPKNHSKLYNARIQDSSDVSSETTISSSTCGSSVQLCTDNETTSDDGHDWSLNSAFANERQIKQKPMIKIVQEMTEQRVVVSTIEVNRRKVHQWKQLNKTVELSKDVPLKNNNKSKQRRIISENFCNEILDKNRETNRCDNCTKNDQWSASEDVSSETEGNEDVTLVLTDHDAEPIATGKLMGGSGKKISKNAGKLMAKRLLRQSTDGHFQSQQKNKLSNSAPAKPPRTFYSSKYESSSDVYLPKSSQQQMRAASAPFNENTTSAEKKKSARKLGWIFQKEIDVFENSTSVPNDAKSNNHIVWKRDMAPSLPYDKTEWKPDLQKKPTCPSLEEIAPENKKIRLGWVANAHNEHQQIPQHIVNMLCFDRKTEAAVMSSSKLPAQPQVALSPKFLAKENIDDVDGAPIHSSKQMDRFCTETVFSTPQRNTNSQLDSTIMDVSIETETDDVCMNCHCPNNRTSSQTQTKPSFSQKAFRRTKTLLVAGKNILHRSSVSNNIPQDINRSDNDNVFESNTPIKLDTTERMNKMSTSHTKPTEKQLDISHIPPVEVTVESPKRMYDMYLASVKRTPPPKPTRKNVNIVSQSQNNFDFQRTVRSPSPQRSAKTIEPSKKSHGFLLSPRRLFCKTDTRRHSLNIEPASGSYKSFMDQDDDGM